jgi:lysozyme
MSDNRARGFDCSEYNNIDWGSIVDDISFCMIRSSSGIGYVDKAMEKHYAGAKSRGFLVGFYHYVMMSRDPVVQAQFFFKTATSNGKTPELPFAMDFEYPDDIMKRSADEQVNFLGAMGDELVRLSGQKPLIYSFPSAFKDSLARSANAASLKRFGYWPADLSKGSWPSETATPYQAPFMDEWEFWQTSGNKNGTTEPSAGSKVLQGFHGMAIDQDVFNGTKEQLFTKYSPSAPAYAAGAGSVLGTLGLLTAIGAAGFVAYDKFYR